MKTDNELIHEFMGHDWKKEYFQWHIGSITPMTLEHLEHYQTSWNWLMPVVEKIATEYQKMDYPICPELIKIHSLTLFDGIEKVYSAVVEYIKWHNYKTAFND